MKSFQFLVTDDRYTVPTLVFVESLSKAAAKALAKRQLESDRHYRAVEVWEGDAMIYSLAAPAPS